MSGRKMRSKGTASTGKPGCLRRSAVLMLVVLTAFLLAAVPYYAAGETDCGREEWVIRAYGAQVEGQETGKPDRALFTAFPRRWDSFFFRKDNLLPFLTVHENIALQMRGHGSREDTEDMGEILRFLELEEELDLYPRQLSDTQRQRAALAGALASGRAVIFADLPACGADSCGGARFLELLQRTSAAFRRTIAVKVRRPGTAEAYIYIENGKICT